MPPPWAREWSRRSPLERGTPGFHPGIFLVMVVVFVLVMVLVLAGKVVMVMVIDGGNVRLREALVAWER